MDMPWTRFLISSLFFLSSTGVCFVALPLAKSTRYASWRHPSPGGRKVLCSSSHLPTSSLFQLRLSLAVFPSGDQPTDCVQEFVSRVNSSARTRRPVPSALTTTARLVDVAPARQVGAHLCVAD